MDFILLGFVGIWQIVLILIGLSFFGLWIYALVDVLNSEFKGSNKLIWILVVLLLGILGVLLYLIIGRKQKTKSI